MPINGNEGSGTDTDPIRSLLGIISTSTTSGVAPPTASSAPIISASPNPGGGLALDLNGQLSTSVARQTAGFEFAYSEFTAPVIANTVAENAAVTIVTAAAVNFDGKTTVLIEFGCPALVTGGATNQIGVNLWDAYNGAAAADQGRLFDGTTVATPAGNYPGELSRRLTPALGTHTYSIRIWSVAATNFVAEAGAGGAGTKMPGYIKIRRV